MTALIVIDLTPAEDKLNTYNAMATQILVPYGSEIMVKDPIETLHGEFEYLISQV